VKQVTFSLEQKAHIVYKIKHYFNTELDEEIGQFDAEFLLEFFGNEIGAYYYNKGLQDATEVIGSQTDVMKEALYTMEEPTL
jgi:uncharacterized protein (DUF2164 family)